MTQRQQALAEDIQKLRAEILLELERPCVPARRVGDIVLYRLPTKWGDGMLRRAVQIVRVPDGYEWREHAMWFRKGRTPAKWRPL